MRPAVVRAVATATFREFWRTKEAVFWSYGFPLILAIALGLAFAAPQPPPVRVLVEAGSRAAALEAALAADPRLVVRIGDAAAAERMLALGTADIVVVPGDGGVTLRRDPTRPDSELADLLVRRRLQLAAGRVDPLAVSFEPVLGPGSRYIDFLVPGLVALNLLGMGMFGIGFNLVHMRAGKLLRRLLVTPMTRAEFMWGFLSSRFVLALPASVVILVFGAVVFGVPCHGSLVAVAALVLAGGFALSGLGFLVASRVRTLEGAGGLINLVQLPLWLMGGVFFASDRFPGWLQPAVAALPTTQITGGLRGVMLEGQGLSAVWAPVSILTAFGAVTLALAARIFRWS